MTRARRWTLLAALVGAGFASAQGALTGTLSGTVRDGAGPPVSAATVTVTSAQGLRTFSTDTSGRFLAPHLTPGAYTVTVEASGFSTLEWSDIPLRLGQQLELSLSLTPGPPTPVVQVTTAAPVIDLATTTTGGTLDADRLQRLPVGRTFTDTFYLLPGVSDSSGVGRANPSIAGAAGLDNQYFVDGVNVTHTGFAGIGSYSIVFGSLGLGLTHDVIQETEVKSGGFEAEYGQATGGVVNAVTRGGTNSFRGALYGYFRPYGLSANYKQLDTPNGTVNTTDDANTDFGLSLGGPLVPNKLFFFGAVNPQVQKRKFIAPVDYPLRSLGAVERQRKVYAYAAKLTWQINPDHRLQASAFGDPSKGDNGPQRFTALRGSDTAQFSRLDTYGGHNQSVRYDGIISPSWLVEAAFARSTNKINEIPSVDTWATTDLTVVPNVRSGGIGFYDKGGEGKNLQYSLKSTHIFDAGGNHQFRYGVAYEDITFAREFGRTGPPVTLSNGIVTRTGVSGLTIRADPNVPGGRFYRASRANFGAVPDTKAKYYNFFAQDTWQIGKKLTFRPGIRWEKQRLVGGGTPLCYANDSRPGAGDGSGTAILCEKTFTGAWGPRIGATYDIFGNGKSKIYASWGRFYSKIPNDLASRALSADAGISRADWYDAGLTRPIPEGVLVGGVTRHLVLAPLPAAQFDPAAKSTYEDEFLGGLEFELAPALSLGIRYIHRSIPNVLEDVGTLSLTAYELPDTPGDVEYFITNVGPQIQTQCFPGFMCGFEDPVHIYDAVELTVDKRFSDHWGLLGSYRWSRLKGNYEGFFRADNGQSDPAITSLFDFPTNDPSYAAVGVPEYGFRGDIRYLGDSLGRGPLPNDRTHQIKVYATRAFGGLTLGLGWNAGSGRVLTPLAANPRYNNSGEIPESVRGGGIETVSVSGCGQCGGFRRRSPFETSVDLHADFTLHIGTPRLVLLADAFNLLDRQTPTAYDTATEQALGVVNRNYGYPANGAGAFATSYQAPRQIRLGARLEW